MREVRFSQPKQDDFVRPPRKGTPLPKDQAVTITDWRSASIACMRFVYDNHLADCTAEIFEDGKSVAWVSSNGRVWPPQEYQPGMEVFYEPTMADLYEAAGRDPPTDEERAEFAAKYARMKEKVSWPKPTPIKVKQKVLVFTNPWPINAYRAVVIAVRERDYGGSGPEYKTKANDEEPRWTHEEWVHARLSQKAARLHPQVLATLRAEFAALPVKKTGKSLGEIINEALYASRREATLKEYARIQQAADDLLDEMVRLAGRAFAQGTETVSASAVSD